jgi:hypothetical protein
MSMGQVDMAFYNHKSKMVMVIEAKSSLMLSVRQKQRLFAAANYLGELFGAPSQVFLAIPNNLPKSLSLIKL